MCGGGLRGRPRMARRGVHRVWAADRQGVPLRRGTSLVRRRRTRGAAHAAMEKGCHEVLPDKCR